MPDLDNQKLEQGLKEIVAKRGMKIWLKEMGR